VYWPHDFSQVVVVSVIRRGALQNYFYQFLFLGIWQFRCWTRRNKQLQCWWFM